MPAVKIEDSEKPVSREKVLGTAGSFTGLWALTWLGVEAVGASAAVQGGFAVGGVMAASGLTVLWWKTRALKELIPDGEAQKASEAEADPPPEETRMDPPE